MSILFGRVRQLGMVVRDCESAMREWGRLGVGPWFTMRFTVDDFVYRGHHGAVPVVGVVEVEQGRVKAWREYYDRGQMLEAMGLKEDFDVAQRR